MRIRILKYCRPLLIILPLGISLAPLATLATLAPLAPLAHAAPCYNITQVQVHSRLPTSSVIIRTTTKIRHVKRALTTYTYASPLKRGLMAEQIWSDAILHELTPLPIRQYQSPHGTWSTMPNRPAALPSCQVCLP